VHLRRDEFGHTSIPEFSTISTTIRKYVVSLSVIIQYFSQLHTYYEEREAQTIIESRFQSKLFLPVISTQASSELMNADQTKRWCETLLFMMTGLTK